MQWLRRSNACLSFPATGVLAQAVARGEVYFWRLGSDPARDFCLGQPPVLSRVQSELLAEKLTER